MLISALSTCCVLKHFSNNDSRYTYTSSLLEKRKKMRAEIFIVFSHFRGYDVHLFSRNRKRKKERETMKRKVLFFFFGVFSPSFDSCTPSHRECT